MTREDEDIAQEDVSPVGHESAAAIEEVESETEDHEVSLKTYEILTYPTDYTLETLVGKWNKDQIKVPKFQRGFVWSQSQASKLIESFLLGLPVPAIFLYSDKSTNDLMVVDGQQRLRTIAHYFEGYFGPETAGRRPVFRLKGLDESSPYLGKTYEDLEESEPAAFAKLNDSVLRAFVIKQLDPSDDTSIYHVFERLNTGGTSLTQQEIRNCVRHGPLNDLLIQLNKNADWRAIFGRPTPDKRQRDVELVLRFLSLHYESERYEKPMKDFLNKFMDRHQKDKQAKLTEFEEVFTATATSVLDKLGPRPFHIRAGLNAAVFDAVFTAVARNLGNLPYDLDGRYRTLVHDLDFARWTSSATTDKEVVGNRLSKAIKVLTET